MVLSGSKVKPDSSIQECSLAVKRANAYLKQTKKALERSEKTVTERLTAIERRDSEGNEKVSQEELLHIIRILVTNVQGNERAKREAEIAVANARDNFRRTVLQFLSGGVAGAVAPHNSRADRQGKNSDANWKFAVKIKSIPIYIYFTVPKTYCGERRNIEALEGKLGQLFPRGSIRRHTICKL